MVELNNTKLITKPTRFISIPVRPNQPIFLFYNGTRHEYPHCALLSKQKGAKMRTAAPFTEAAVLI